MGFFPLVTLKSKQNIRCALVNLTRLSAFCFSNRTILNIPQSEKLGVSLRFSDTANTGSLSLIWENYYYDWPCRFWLTCFATVLTATRCFFRTHLYAKMLLKKKQSLCFLYPCTSRQCSTVGLFCPCFQRGDALLACAARCHPNRWKERILLGQNLLRVPFTQLCRELKSMFQELILNIRWGIARNFRKTVTEKF